MKHILVVDNTKFHRNIIKILLASLGHKVTVACNGKEGLEYFSNPDRFALVITDINMPIVNGIEFARAIRNSDSPETPIIAVTATFEDIGTERDLFNSIILKPFELKSLKKIVSQHLKF